MRLKFGAFWQPEMQRGFLTIALYQPAHASLEQDIAMQHAISRQRRQTAFRQQQRTALALLFTGLLTIGGCAPLPPDHGRGQVDRLLAERGRPAANAELMAALNAALDERDCRQHRVAQ
ncbi:MAG: hypothetical protein R3E50_09975 [Halioglobus sp.]